MSIKKITPGELLENGISGLPTRPSAPSLYSGKTLSAAELREAFDRLPTLIASRYNALLDATGLFDDEMEKEAFASLIATNLAEGHSLEDLFADITSGTFASYLSADGTRTLREVLEALEDALARVDEILIDFEGEGDIVSDISFENNILMLHKSLSSKQLLALAKAYSDAPKGALSAEETRPVSGGILQSALDEKLEKNALAPLESRVKALEAFAEGTLYSYDYYDYDGAGCVPPEGALGKARVCLLGARVLPASNVFPEKLLARYHYDTLSIDWDEAAGCLVFNGTLPQGETHLMDFILPIQSQNLCAALFYRSGSALSASGDAPTLRFYTETDTLTNFLTLEQSDALSVSVSAPTEDNIGYLTLHTAEETVFTDYRCNLLLRQNALTVDSYTKADFCPTVTKPCAFSVYSRNLWKDTSSVSGSAFLEALASEPYPEGTYTLSFRVQSTVSANTNRLFLLFADGSEKMITLKKSVERASTSFTCTTPFCGFRLYAANTESNSTGEQVAAIDIMLEAGTSASAFVPYKEPVRTEIPVRFRSFSEYGLGLDTLTFNYLDLENRNYYTGVRAITLCGEESFEADPDIPGRFVYKESLPEDFSESELSASGLFYPLSAGAYQSFWVEDGQLMLQSVYAKTKEELLSLLADYPFRIFYVSPRSSIIVFPPDAYLDDSEIYLSLSKGDLIRVETEEGSPSQSIFCMLYQIKNTEV